jgi:hypothetical protein
VSSRPRRALVGLVVAAAALAALPASALAAGETLSVAPANPQAGGLTNVSTTLTFDPADTPSTVVTSLAPGLLGNLNANPACLIGSQQLTSACQIGTASVTIATPSSNTFTGKLYLVPAATGSSDASGIEFVPDAGSPPQLTNQYFGVTLNPNAPGSLNLTTTFPNPSPAHITGFTANFTTLNGQEFTRLPSSCSAATTTASIKYYGVTPAGSASGSFTPTGCANLPYAPALTAAIDRDSAGGAALTLGITQAANESASKTIVLQLPKGLTPNVPGVATCLNATGCKIGTATATSPIVPSVALANGSVTLTAQGTVPSITVSFPAPFAISLTGAVNLNNNSVTFANVPDVPLTALTLSVTGTSSGKAFNTDCAPANIGGTFTPQSGTAAKTVSAPIKFTHCALKPTVSGSTAGLASGHPKLKFKITHGKGAPNVASVTLGLPRGLSFSRSAIVKHKTCTKASKGKKAKCSTTTLIKGLGIAGGKAKSVAIKRGKLVITLKKASGKLTITVSGPLVSESKSLQTKVKKHKTKSLKFSLKVTDAKRHATTVSLKLRAH